ncbi:MAG TPA: polysaccharide deacetylase family protein [Thermoanaerobaculia bacterium]|nr:polysaccharide deacetylase family protein [Thermoanaerobaculia bacterium]
MRNLIVAFGWLAPFVAIVAWPWSPAAAIAVVALSHALILYPTLRPNVQWLGPVITRFETHAREVWLTIDDGPTADTPALLDLLAKTNTPATFFLKGRIADPVLVGAILDRGHSIGNHSFSHPSAWFWCYPSSWIAEEIDRCNGVLGARKWFRAPVGMKNPSVHPLLSARGMRLIGWTARGFDGVRADPQRVASRIVPRVRPGAIVVMHQGRPQSLACIERVIDTLRADGYSFVIPADDRLKTNR